MWNKTFSYFASFPIKSNQQSAGVMLRMKTNQKCGIKFRCLYTRFQKNRAEMYLIKSWPVARVLDQFCNFIFAETKRPRKKLYSTFSTCFGI